MNADEAGGEVTVVGEVMALEDDSRSAEVEAEDAIEALFCRWRNHVSGYGDLIRAFVKLCYNVTPVSAHWEKCPPSCLQNCPRTYGPRTVLEALGQTFFPVCLYWL